MQDTEMFPSLILFISLYTNNDRSNNIKTIKMISIMPTQKDRFIIGTEVKA